MHVGSRLRRERHAGRCRRHPAERLLRPTARVQTHDLARCRGRQRTLDVRPDAERLTAADGRLARGSYDTPGPSLPNHSRGGAARAAARWAGGVVGGCLRDGFLTTRDGLLVTVVDPPAFLAVTITRSEWPTSWTPGLYVSQ